MSPRSQKANEKVRSESIEKIILASMELFGSQGYANISISQIAKKAGVSQGLMYNYFTGKEHLLESIIQRIFLEMERFMGTHHEGISPAEKVKNMIESYFVVLEKQKEFWLLAIPVITQRSLSDKLRGHFLHWFSMFIQEMESVFQELNFTQPKAEAYKIGATLDGIALNYLFIFKEDYPIQEVKASLLKQYSELAH